MSPPAEAFEYDHLTEVYRKEQRTKNVTEVRKDLYTVIRIRLAELRRATEREFALDQFSTRAKLAANQLTKFQERADQVFEFRMEKILAMALRAARGNRVDTGRLTAEEAGVFDKVSSLLRERQASLLAVDRVGSETIEAQAGVEAPIDMPGLEEDTLPCDGTSPEEMGQADLEPGMPPHDDAALERRGPEAVEEQLPLHGERVDSATTVEPVQGTGRDILVIRVVEDLPPFAGPGKDYRLRKEDVVCLPQAVAKALVARGKATIIQVSEL